MLRCQRINKWISARRGRMTLLANLLGKKKQDLYNLISQNRLSADLMQAIERAQIDVEKMEKQCIQDFAVFKRFVKKGDGRVPRLAAKIDMPVHKIRNLAKKTGEGRFLMISLGLDKIIKGVRDCERESRNSSYNTEKINVRAYMDKSIKNKLLTFDELINVADEIRQNADTGNHDAAVICRESGGRYKIISIGFDMAFSNMGKSHVCDKQNPHVHAVMFAALNVPKQDANITGDIVLFSHHAPCPNCAERLINVGVQRAYCLYEPELQAGLVQLGLNFIPVFKYNIAEKKLRKMNDVEQAA